MLVRPSILIQKPQIFNIHDMTEKTRFEVQASVDTPNKGALLHGYQGGIKSILVVRCRPQ